MSKKAIIWIFVMILLLFSVNAWLDCAPESCPFGYTDNGIVCTGGTCTRNCTIAMCGSSWTQVHSSTFGWSYVEEDEKYGSSGTYTPTSTDSCYNFTYDGPPADRTYIQMDVLPHPTYNCRPVMIGGFKGGNNWFSDMSYYTGSQANGLVSSMKWVVKASMPGEQNADDNYLNEASKSGSIYCAPNSVACGDLGGTVSCDIDCYNQGTNGYALQAYYRDQGTDLATLYRGSTCGDSYVDLNRYREIAFTVYTTPIETQYDEKKCDRTNEAPIASNVNIIPKNPTAGDDLICNYTYFDMEDFEEKGSTFNWKKNGVSQNINSQILGKGNLSVGNQWSCGVTPKDGLSIGTTQASNTITIVSTVQNPKMYVENSLFWNSSGYYSGSETIKGFVDELNNALKNCTPDSEGNCNISITFSSNSSGRINASAIRIYYYIKPLRPDGSPCNKDSQCLSGYCDNDGIGWTDDGWCFSVENVYYDNQDHKCEEKARTANDDWCDEKRNEDLDTCNKTGEVYKEDYCSDTCTISDKTIFECNENGCSCAQPLCDGLDTGSGITTCAAGLTYFADECTSNASTQDRGDNICRSSAFAAGCTADPQCNGVTAGTGNCNLSCNYISPPIITLLSPINNAAYNTTSIDLNWTVDKEVDWCAYSLDGEANDTSILGPTNITLIILKGGPHNLTIYCADILGNTGQSNYVYFIVENLPPIVELILNIIVNESDLIKIEINAIDPNNDALYYYINDSRFNQTNNTFKWQTQDNAGRYIVNISVSDGEFNVSQLVTITINDICMPNWIEINTTCRTNDTKIGYYIDNNLCYEQTNLLSDLIGKPDNNTYECNYCSESIIGPFNTSCIPNDTLIQYYVDENFDSCCAITNLESDCSIIYNTLFQNKTLWCDYCKPFWQCNGWDSCLINDTQYCNSTIDTNNCYSQTALPSDLYSGDYSEFNPLECNYCSEDIQGPLYTDWSDCTIYDNQTRRGYYVDNNYETCCLVTNIDSDCNINNGSYTNSTEVQICNYCTPIWININSSCASEDYYNITYVYTNDCCAITGLSSDCNIPENTTAYCDYCTPSLVNTTWTDWINETQCLINDTQLQKITRTQYDENNCNEFENITFSNYRTVECDYCTPNWVEINESCTLNRTLMAWYNDSRGCYIITGLASDLEGKPDNKTYTCVYLWNINISLNKGWNLISIPLELPEKLVSSIFSNLNITIFSYKNNSWFVPDEVDNKLGYWLKINESKNLTLIGTEIENITIELNKGWNLISYPSLNTTLINESLKDVVYDLILTYENDKWSSYSPTRPSYLDTLTNLTPFYGYWVKVPENVTWTFDGNFK